LYPLKILLVKTDSDYTLTVPEMIIELNKYNINEERKSIYDDIDFLKPLELISYVENQRPMITILQAEHLN
jgi:hypothetical protein